MIVYFCDKKHFVKNLKENIFINIELLINVLMMVLMKMKSITHTHDMDKLLEEHEV